MVSFTPFRYQYDSFEKFLKKVVARWVAAQPNVLCEAILIYT